MIELKSNLSKEQYKKIIDLNIDYGKIPIILKYKKISIKGVISKSNVDYYTVDMETNRYINVQFELEPITQRIVLENINGINIDGIEYYLLKDIEMNYYGNKYSEVYISLISEKSIKVICREMKLWLQVYG